VRLETDGAAVTAQRIDGRALEWRIAVREPGPVRLSLRSDALSAFPA
jgi:hypothetical protein